jgi:hypothetical protein
MPTAPAPDLDVMTTPVPAVTIDLTSIPTSTDQTFLTVLRSVDGSTEAVRNASSVDITGDTAFSVIDFDAPFGIGITYTARLVIGGVDQGLGPASIITLDSTQIFISDPIDPVNAIGISLDGSTGAFLGEDSFTSVERRSDRSLVNVLGKAKPIQLFYGQKGIVSLDFEVYTQGEDTLKMTELLRASPLLLRKTPNIPNLPFMLHGSIDGFPEDVDWKMSNQPITQWSMTLNETEPQSLDIVFGVFDYTYWNDAFDTYTEALAIYGAGTYEDAKKNPPA